MNGEDMGRNRVRRRVERGVRFAMFRLVAVTVFGFVVKALWNWLIRLILLIGGERIPVKASEEYLIPRGVLHSGEVSHGWNEDNPCIRGHRADRERSASCGN